jgi:hypothetical protein
MPDLERWLTRWRRARHAGARFALAEAWRSRPAIWRVALACAAETTR